jgi:butyrate kinase
MKILAINPGSTSTKIAVFHDEQVIWHATIRHKPSELAHFKDAMDQFDYRQQLVLTTLEAEHIPFDFDVIVGRGGLVKPVEGGVYEINEKIYEDTKHAMCKHACNLGSLIAHSLAHRLPNCKALMADPGVVDELDDIARVNGSPLMPRFTIWHALNQRAIAPAASPRSIILVTKISTSSCVIWEEVSRWPLISMDVPSMPTML